MDLREADPSDASGHPAPSAVDWSPLIRAHQHRVVLSLLAAGLSFERATELANEAWTRLMEKHRSGRLVDLKLPGLAIVQARFLAWDERRRERAQAGATEAQLVDGAPDPEQRLLGRQQASLALEAIAAASESTQRVFKLVYQEPRMPHAQVAERLGLSVQRVRQILCELRKRVRAAIEGEPS